MAKTTKRLVEEFDEAARWWAWESDRGIGSSVFAAEKTYAETKKCLLNRIERLEKENKEWRFSED